MIVGSIYQDPPIFTWEYIPGPSSPPSAIVSIQEDIAALRLEINELRAAKGLRALGSKEKLFRSQVEEEYLDVPGG